MAALWDRVRQPFRGTVLRALFVSAALVLLGASGCHQPDRVIDNLPPPTTGYRPQPPRATGVRPIAPAPRPPIASAPRWKWWVKKPAPPVARDSIAPESGWVPRMGIGRQWECIVIHHSANDKDTPRSMDAWHRQRGWECLGYDFVIGNGVGYPDGQVFVGPRWANQMVGAHCKTPGAYYNEHGIGICLIGNMENHRPSERQMQALARLVLFLEGQCGISSSKIMMHGGITHKTACPGRYFSIGDLMRRINAR
jgi:hypothetical protein